MRVAVAAPFVALALVAAGCASSSASNNRAASLSGDAAKLVPADAKAFAAIDSDLSSPQWKNIDTLTASFPIHADLFAKLNKIAPALGPEVDAAVLGKKEVAAFTQPSDESKLAALASTLHYSVQQIGGWSVVADSPEVFNAIRAAQSGQSLGDTSAFQTAWSSVAGDGLARVYVQKRAGWAAARVNAESDALRVDGVLQPNKTLPASGSSWLLGDVPSGADLAVAFRGSGDLGQKVRALKLGKSLPIAKLAPLLSGGGVLYVRANGLVPDVAAELAPKNPQSALALARALIAKFAGKLGPVQLTAQLSGDKLVIADSAAAAAGFSSAAKLVDDAAYTDAITKAGVTSPTIVLAYANVPALVPYVSLVLQAVTGKAPDPALADNLAHVGTAVAWANRSGARVQFHAWLEPR